MSTLVHYGIKGQKWGVRRFENMDGTLTEEGKRRYSSAKSYREVQQIFGNFSKKDKKLIDAGENDTEFLSKEATSYWVAKRFIAHEGKTPVAWLDIIRSSNEGEANIAIGTDPNYRGKGHASKLVKQGAKWLDDHSSEFSKVNWDAHKHNAASIRLAQKSGFRYDHETDTHVTYTRRKG